MKGQLEMTVEFVTATDRDGAAVAEIYRYFVDETLITFDYTAPSAEDWAHKIVLLQRGGHPFIVAVENERVIGFAYTSAFRDKDAYDWTVENTIYLHPSATGRGIGKALLAELLTQAGAAGFRRAIAVIAIGDELGEGSVALHRKLGFVEVGRLPGVGFKFDQWVDCVLLQLAIGPDGPPTLPET